MCKGKGIIELSYFQIFHEECSLSIAEFGLNYKVGISLICKEDGCKFFAINQIALDRSAMDYSGEIFLLLYIDIEETLEAL